MTERRHATRTRATSIEAESPLAPLFTLSAAQVRQELLSIRGLLAP